MEEGVTEEEKSLIVKDQGYGWYKNKVKALPSLSYHDPHQGIMTLKLLESEGLWNSGDAVAISDLFKRWEDEDLSLKLKSDYGQSKQVARGRTMGKCPK